MRVCLELLPAEVRGEHIEDFILGDERVERISIRPVNHVALVCGPPVQRPAVDKRNREQR